MIQGQIFGKGKGKGGGSLENELTSTQNVGGITVGQVFPAGTPVADIFKAMLEKEEAPRYQPPTLSLSVGYAGNSLHEIGTTLSLSLSATYNQRDGGAADQVDFRANGSSVHVDSEAPFTHDYAHRLVADLVLQASVGYQAGPVKDTNLGNPSPSGQIPAGSKNSNTVTLKAVRRAFWGTGRSSGSSAQVRALSNSLLNPTNGRQFTINIPAGADSVVFAYPASLPAVEKVIYAEGLNADVKGAFVETSLDVEGAEGYAAVAYRVYRYVPAEPFSQPATYTVTI